MTKTILYGGTFNPIHKGHIALCLWAWQQLDAQRVILMPTACPPTTSSCADADAPSAEHTHRQKSVVIIVFFM